MPFDVDQLVGAAVRWRRADLGLSQRDLAEIVAYTQPWVSQLEHGDISVSVKTFFILAQALELTAEGLLKIMRATQHGRVRRAPPSHPLTRPRTRAPLEDMLD